jgi:hypothetical protein
MPPVQTSFAHAFHHWQSVPRTAGLPVADRAARFGARPARGGSASTAGGIEARLIVETVKSERIQAEIRIAITNSRLGRWEGSRIFLRLHPTFMIDCEWHFVPEMPYCTGGPDQVGGHALAASNRQASCHAFVRLSTIKAPKFRNL